MELCSHFHLEHPLLLGLHLLGLLTVCHLLVQAVLTGNYGFWSRNENIGLYASLCLTSIYFTLLVWAAIFFHKHERKHYIPQRLFVINICLCVVYLLGLAVAHCILQDPSKGDMKKYIVDIAFHDNGNIPGSFAAFQNERKCCGVDGYMDFCRKGTNRSTCAPLKLPKSCCRSKSVLVADRNRKKSCFITSLNVSSAEVKKLHGKGCLPRGISDAYKSDVYFKILIIKAVGIIPLLFPLITLILIQLLILMTRPKDKDPIVGDVPAETSSIPKVRLSLPRSSHLAGQGQQQGGGGEDGDLGNNSDMDASVSLQ